MTKPGIKKEGSNQNKSSKLTCADCAMYKKDNKHEGPCLIRENNDHSNICFLFNSKHKMKDAVMLKLKKQLS